MAYGYSNTMAKQIEEKHRQNPDDPLFALLAICVQQNIVPSTVAAKLGVSKQTIYDWIGGKYSPRPDTFDEIKTQLKQARKQYGKKG